LPGDFAGSLVNQISTYRALAGDFSGKRTVPWAFDVLAAASEAAARRHPADLPAAPGRLRHTRALPRSVIAGQHDGIERNVSIDPYR
jgi:hypothetical protein